MQVREKAALCLRHSDTIHIYCRAKSLGPVLLPNVNILLAVLVAILL